MPPPTGMEYVLEFYFLIDISMTIVQDFLKYIYFYQELFIFFYFLHSSPKRMGC